MHFKTDIVTINLTSLVYALMKWLFKFFTLHFWINLIIHLFKVNVLDSSNLCIKDVGPLQIDLNW